MPSLTLTDTVRSYLTPLGIDWMTTFMSAITKQMPIIVGDNPCDGHIAWRLDLDALRVEVAICLPVTEQGADLPLAPVWLSFNLHPDCFIGPVPEEHTYLFVHDEKVWIFDELRAIDPALRTHPAAYRDVRA